MNNHAIPLIRRRFLGATKPLLASLVRVICPVKTPDASERRNPQFRQKRRSDGIFEWQFEQDVRSAVSGIGIETSEFCVISRLTCHRKR